ncbi:MAG: S49 family peptidase, partial [Candidatus Krumholzibacteria bacterium]|nr:S49 family peptidase [Candidatus Krumholzibacteria bacterium]
MTRRWKYLVLLLFLAFFLVVIPMMVFLKWTSADFRLETGKVAVVVELRGKMFEYYPHFSPAAFFGRKKLTLTEVLSCIDRAERDSRVEALVLKIFPSGAGAVKCEEIRDAAQRFRKTGKKVIAFSPILANYHYLVACASDSIFMPPSGFLMIQGPASSAVFVRGTLDKLGITPNIHGIGDYKAAAEFFTETHRTPASREMTQWLLDDMFERFVTTVAEER